MSINGIISWGVAAVLILGISIDLFASLYSDDESIFLPGESSHAHYQIEMDCAACHLPDGGVDDSGCIQCHQAELDAFNDSHPQKKFKDPRSADQLENIDAMSCITCHREHMPERTHAMAVTMPDDYCIHCHAEIGSERPTHQDLSFETCLTAGCHNYHDNTALYYEFLLKHADQPMLKDEVSAASQH